MTDATVKDVARQSVENLPEEATWENLQYEIYFRQAADSGLKDPREGRTLSLDEVRHRFGIKPK